MLPESRRLFYWDQDTAGLPFETGIQRVVRRLRAGLIEAGVNVRSVGFDPVRRVVAGLDRRPSRGAWLLVPELTTGVVAQGADPIQFGRAYGLRTAVICHDLIPMKLVSLYADADRALYARYYRNLVSADLVFTTTGYVAADLRHFAASEGLPTPEIKTIPLPAQFAATTRRPAQSRPPSPGHPLRVLIVTTLERRKNLPLLLRAIRCGGERAIEARIVGRRVGDDTYEAEIATELATLSQVHYLGPVDDDALAELHAWCDLGVYPSPEEGFGLPVLESLWLGKPCLCHDNSSLAEVAPGGGTLAIDFTDEDAVAAVLGRLIDDPSLLVSLSAEIDRRPLTTWADYSLSVADRLGLLLPTYSANESSPLRVQS